MRGILFDKDGTLLDFEATWTPIFKRLALQHAEGDEARATALLVAGGYVPATGKFRAGSIIGAGTAAAIVQLWHPDLSGDALREKAAEMDRAFGEHGQQHSVPINGAMAALEILGLRRFVMGVATNDATASAKAALDSVGMTKHLPHVFGYDSVANAKPAPDMVLAFAAASRLTPEEIVVVGDNVHDLEMARSAGAGWAVGVTSGNSAKQDLAPFADAVLPSIRELPGWLHQNKK